MSIAVRAFIPGLLYLVDGWRTITPKAKTKGRRMHHRYGRKARWLRL
jgi:hypothetical protein